LGEFLRRTGREYRFCVCVIRNAERFFGRTNDEMNESYRLAASSDKVVELVHRLEVASKGIVHPLELSSAVMQTGKLLLETNFPDHKSFRVFPRYETAEEWMKAPGYKDLGFEEYMKLVEEEEKELNE